MKKLEDKILNKVYMYETKKTVFELIMRFSLIISIGTLSMILIFDTMIQLAEQQTLDLLQLFREDTETIRMYAGDVVKSIYEEWPKFDSAMLLVLLIGLSISVLLLMKNVAKIKNKMNAISRHWLRR